MTTWTIGEAAAKCGLSQHTLRWYERIGLLARHRAARSTARRCAGPSPASGRLKLLDAKIELRGLAAAPSSQL